MFTAGTMPIRSLNSGRSAPNRAPISAQALQSVPQVVPQAVRRETRDGKDAFARRRSIHARNGRRDIIAIRARELGEINWRP